VRYFGTWETSNLDQVCAVVGFSNSETLAVILLQDGKQSTAHFHSRLFSCAGGYFLERYETDSD